jgi:titin
LVVGAAFLWGYASKKRMTVNRLATAAAICILGTAAIAPAATFTVTNTSDSGPDSLRQAILDANTTPGADLITFNIPGPGVHTISPLSALPALADDAGVTIDGYTQPGSSPNTLAIGDNAVLLIELRGMGLMVGPGVNGLLIQSARNIVRGLVINRFDRGIWIQRGSGNEVTGCFIGTDASGSVALPNRGGVLVGGTDKFDVEGARIGGLNPASRNILSGNSQVGVGFAFRSLSSFVQGNLIGTNVQGLGAVPNEVGVAVQGFGIQVGGRTPGAGNVISGNSDAGVIVAFTANTIIEGNLVGTTAAGNAALPNRFGVECEADLSTSVGGTEPGAGNVISGNTLDGVLIFFNAAKDTVTRNFIGTDATGRVPLGNGRNGVTIRLASNGNTIGAASADAGNNIAFNGSAGVAVGFDATDSSSGNSILRNSIHDNAGLGIDLGSNGVTPNDPADADAGPNGLQNFPVLTSAVSTAGVLTVTGSLDSVANTTFIVELFSSSSCDPSGYGEGQSFLGTVSVTTDAAGRTTFQAAVPTPAGSAGFVTATATDPGGNTSEFSACITLAVGPSAPVPISPVALAGLAVLLAASGLALCRRG